MTSVSLSLAPAGEMVRLKMSGLSAVGGGKRGIVAGFSSASRSRLMRKLSTLRKSEMPLFVTLTYPDNFPSTEVSKEHFRAFIERLRREYSEDVYYYSEDGRQCVRSEARFGLIWKLEYQHRGAPHYHLLLWGLTLDEARDFIPSAWYDIAGGGDINHLYFHLGKLGNRPCIESVKSWHGVKSYASKYMSKPIAPDENGSIHTGRVWGVRGKIPLSPIMSFSLDIQSALHFKRLFGGYLNSKARLRGRRFVRGARLGFWMSSYFPDIHQMIEHSIDLSAPPPPPAFPPGWWRSYHSSVGDDSLDYGEFVVNLHDFAGQVL